jgi:hypothetical protein
MTLHGGICRALVFERHCLNLCEHILLDNLRSSKFARACVAKFLMNKTFPPRP